MGFQWGAFGFPVLFSPGVSAMDSSESSNAGL